ncbi:hypothetical protein OPT61_g8456 [Boeremia exigua]|uniref:Uncharacterized protein n=1 Tax=Boeremia exigua TaxID=749465 RepID=A0ACC2HYT1_9PLEO|nr:hypothetical protein OPT61_g8456 [Boeremia exigua]
MWPRHDVPERVLHSAALKADKLAWSGIRAERLELGWPACVRASKLAVRAYWAPIAWSAETLAESHGRALT